MPLDFRKDEGRLVWVQNPFTGTVTYFTHVHKKRSGFVRVRQDAALRAPQPDAELLAAQLRSELEAARQQCPFCPGNEHLTTEEVLRVAPPDGGQGWLIRAFYNLIPRIPECCTGGNESYVIVEDPRHFADDATGHEDLLYTAALPDWQFERILRACVGVARHSYRNAGVKAVLIRKNQGKSSGASQPHVHTQVIGSDRVFPPVEREVEVTRSWPGVWRDIVALVRSEGFLLEERDGCVSYFSPIGVFPRSFDVVAPDWSGPITAAPAALLSAFSRLLHGVLRQLGPMPVDYEIHDGPGVPLHAHVNARHFPYSNIGGTLNLPSSLLASSNSD